MSTEAFLRTQAPAETETAKDILVRFGYENIDEPSFAAFKKAKDYYYANRDTHKGEHRLVEPYSPSEWFYKEGEGLLVSKSEHRYVLVEPQLAEKAVDWSWKEEKNRKDRKKCEIWFKAQQVAFDTAIGFKAFRIFDSTGTQIDVTMDSIFDVFATDSEPDAFAKEIAPYVVAISEKQALLTSVSEPVELTVGSIQELATELHQKITTRSREVAHAKSKEEFLRLYGQLASVAFTNPDFALIQETADAIDHSAVTDISRIDELNKINAHLSQLLNSQQA